MESAAALKERYEGIAHDDWAMAFSVLPRRKRQAL